jgi:hypothetical protein
MFDPYTQHGRRMEGPRWLVPVAAARLFVFFLPLLCSVPFRVEALLLVRRTRAIMHHRSRNRSWLAEWIRRGLLYIVTKQSTKETKVSVRAGKLQSIGGGGGEDGVHSMV